jgi:hypothetical protein
VDESNGGCWLHHVGGGIGYLSTSCFERLEITRSQ